MLLKRTNIEERLRQLSLKQVNQNSLLDEVYQLLHEEDLKDQRIEKNISTASEQKANKFDFDLLQTENIYHIEQIKNICIDYRLRFLDAKYFKGVIPQSAVSKIKQLEKDHGIEIKGFKIMAPSRLFKLQDKDDPLLFAPLGNGYFYLIHKWGNDLHPLRKLLVWPFKSIGNLILLVLLVSYVTTLMIPSGLFSKTAASSEFWIIFFFMFKCIASVVIFYGFALGKNFNPAIWNSKYFNA
ncbi:hypothetical protein [Flagellimonas lutaonensis]|uniref:Membrane protein n=1 Tax=Flagellimonas lutaonensis TaxID=516051 RepID=A0A0D5YW70_9FLAO|nr:hypothetical protein [Allomuricauda lutaonensis]AKA36532.1 membrane protein [Allomuricauda lutaonensis]